MANDMKPMIPKKDNVKKFIQKLQLHVDGLGTQTLVLVFRVMKRF